METVLSTRVWDTGQRCSQIELVMLPERKDVIQLIVDEVIIGDRFRTFVQVCGKRADVTAEKGSRHCKGHRIVVPVSREKGISKPIAQWYDASAEVDTVVEGVIDHGMAHGDDGLPRAVISGGYIVGGVSQFELQVSVQPFVELEVQILANPDAGRCLPTECSVIVRRVAVEPILSA